MPDLLHSLDAVTTAHVLVIGDLILDHYIYGRTDRTSPEAPVPVVLTTNERYLAGGAANVARNIVAAGARTSCIGVCGIDEAGSRLLQTMAAEGVNTEHVIQAPAIQTVQKTRIVSQGQQIVRLDRERPDSIGSTEAEQAWKLAAELIKQCSAVVISDYAKGLLSDDLLQRLIHEAHRLQVPVFVDPKGVNYTRYQGCTVLTPNAREAREATGLAVENNEQLLTAAVSIREAAACDAVIITRGAQGLAILEHNNQVTLIPAAAREVFDVTGAGDTFVAWLAAAMGGGATLDTAAQLANIAAGIVVGKAGAATVLPHEVRQAAMPGRLGRKLLTSTGLKALGEQLRREGKKIVLANGCFDFLHAGHVDFFERARQLGDVLVVATNADTTIKAIKGEGRPVIPGPQRLRILASLESVDTVVMFNEATPHRIIKELRPDILAKGDNYQQSEVEGADLIESYGGQVALVPVTFHFSTGSILGQH